MTRTVAFRILVVLLMMSGFVMAQDAPRVEVFGGYQLVHARSGVPLAGFDSFALNGWDASLSGYFNRYAGITVDVAGTYGTPKLSLPGLGQIGVGTHLYTYMAGPTVRAANKSRLQPFAHALFGAARASAINIAVSAGGTFSVNASNTGFAWVAGGGLDFKVLPLISVRPAQVDFLQTRVGGASQNNFRYSAGVVVSSELVE